MILVWNPQKKNRFKREVRNVFVKKDLDEDIQENTCNENDKPEENLSKEEIFAELLNLKKQLQQEEEKRTQQMQQFLRLQADFKNYQNRVLREREEARFLEAKALMEELLPVLDNFNRAIEIGTEKENFDKFYEGIKMIKTQLWEVLSKNGLEYITCLENQFDPELHQAVMQCEVKEGNDNVVLEEVQGGYLYRNKLIRPSMVKVSKKC